MCCPGKTGHSRTGREHCPASSITGTLFENRGGSRNPHPWELLLAVEWAVEMPFPGRGGWQSTIFGAEGTWEFPTPGGNGRTGWAVLWNCSFFFPPKRKGSYRHLLDGQHFLNISTYQSWVFPAEFFSNLLGNVCMQNRGSGLLS